MFGYYLELAIRGLRRNVVLTALMVLLVGVGIGSSMIMFTTLRAMSGDPIPNKSSQLFAPQIDVWGPANQNSAGGALPTQLPYPDIVALMQAQRGTRQTGTYALQLDVRAPGGRPFKATGRAVYSDFFTMFEVPFRVGAPWRHSEDEKRADVVVISTALASRLFPQGEAVGKAIGVHGHEYRVMGVLDHWSPVPRFYDVREDAFASPDDFYIPFTTAIAEQIKTIDEVSYGACNPPPSRWTGWEAYLHSTCFWGEFWVELPTQISVRDYRAFLHAYAAEQHQLGRFNWTPRVDLHDVGDWLDLNHVVPNEARVRTLMAVGFLIVCLINAAGLMLAKFSGRAMELSVRRALGASRAAIRWQALTETVLVGALGGALGLGLTFTGLAVEHASLAQQAENGVLDALTRVDAGIVAITLGVAVFATLCAGLYPAWRASRVPPAWQLKVQ